jgi:DNA-binding transcriptional LysR family regulator
MLNRNELAAFLSLVETGSFQHAARALGVSNASLSRYIRQAEEQAGFALFKRGRGDTSLTPAGKKMLPLALDLNQDISQFAKRLEDIRSDGHSTLKIGCGPLTTQTVVRPALSEVMRTFPDMRCEIIVKAAVEPMEALTKGEVDIFVGDLTHTPNSGEAEIEIQVLKRQPVIFVACKDHEIHDIGPCSLSDVFRFPFASPFLHKHWRTVLSKALGGTNQDIDRVNNMPQVLCDDYAMVAALLKGSDLVSGGMKETFFEPIALGLLREIKVQNSLLWNICAVRQTRKNTPVMDAFWNAVSRQNQTDIKHL